MKGTPADPLIGSTIFQYEIVTLIGGGGMGVVYKAIDTKLGRAVALKFLPPQWSHDEGAKQRFLREAQAASATNHRNICIIHDIEQTDDGRLFIVMAYYEGQTLKQKLENGALPFAEALEIATEAAEGLAKAHQQGVVHRDVKPGNLMVTDDGVKVLDFGLAKFADSLQLTMPGSTIGTVAYMSPEQARGEEADARSDVWALGVVLYEMLSGRVPFNGAYPEAIFHAIKNEPVPPLGGSDRVMPPALEALVLRVLEKDPDRRYQSARELARDLRLLQGRTVPLDLRTEPLPLMPLLHGPTGAGQHKALSWAQRVRRATPLRAMASLVLLGAIGSYWWVTRPVERIPVPIAPLVNQTGFADLDGYRLALTQTLITELGDSREIRVLPYERLLQMLRRFLESGTDVSSRESLQAIATYSAAPLVIVPTLVRENGAWRARAEFRNTETATNTAVYETDPVVSSLTKETAYSLMASLAEGVQRHFEESGSRRRYGIDAVRRLAGYKVPPITPRMRTLDAAQAFEEGMNAYEQLEYAAAMRAFERATQLDGRSPLLFAWLSRAAHIVRQDDKAQAAGVRAAELVTPETPEVDRLFVAAVSAEAQRDLTAAEARYRELAARDPADPAWFLELASFQDRRTRTADAIAGYHQALEKDSLLARPHLELCRLYNRLNESANAKQEGQRALAAYSALGNRGGEAQASMCLTDRLRLGGSEDRLEARRYAEHALKIFQELRHGYNLARAQYYVALAAEMQGRPVEAMALWEQSLSSARNAGNAVLQPLVLMNLGAMHVQTGNYSRALDYYRQSYEGFEALGDQQRAAQNRANAGVILAQFSDKPDEGLREVQNALGVFRKLDDKDFEVFAAKVTASVHRAEGRHAEAEGELNRALAIARERDIQNKIASLTTDLGRSRFDRSDYATSRKWLIEALGDGSGKDSTPTRIHLGRVHTRLGDFDAAGKDLALALREVEDRSDHGFLPLLHLAMGELAYESNRWREARTHFMAAAALWTDDLPDPASVEAHAALGLLDVLEGRLARARLMVQKSLDQARRTRQFPLEALCRVYLARIQVTERRFDEAIETLAAIPPDDGIVLGPELQARVHYWRGVARAGRGDQAGAQVEESAVQKLMTELHALLPAEFHAPFASRPEIRLLIK